MEPPLLNRVTPLPQGERFLAPGIDVFGNGLARRELGSPRDVTENSQCQVTAVTESGRSSAENEGDSYSGG